MEVQLDSALQLPSKHCAPAPALCRWTVQEELSTWTAAFREKNNRKPNLVDVQRTGEACAGLLRGWSPPRPSGQLRVSSGQPTKGGLAVGDCHLLVTRGPSRAHWAHVHPLCPLCRHPLADRAIQAVRRAARPPLQRHLGAAQQAVGGAAG